MFLFIELITAFSELAPSSILPKKLTFSFSEPPSFKSRLLPSSTPLLRALDSSELLFLELKLSKELTFVGVVDTTGVDLMGVFRLIDDLLAVEFISMTLSAWLIPFLIFAAPGRGGKDFPLSSIDNEGMVVMMSWESSSGNVGMISDFFLLL